jgi:hypothetical protein
MEDGGTKEQRHRGAKYEEQMRKRIYPFTHLHINDPGESLSGVGWRRWKDG